MQPTDTSAIQHLIGRARLRIRSQWALEGATSAALIAAAFAVAAVCAMRLELISRGVELVALGLAGAMVVAGAVARGSRRLDDETIARRIDRASGLSDRLSTAISFRRVLAGGAPADGEESEDFMRAAIHDGVRAVPRANVVAAAPLRQPRHLALALPAAALAVAGALLVDPILHVPRLVDVTPDHARPGEVVRLRGEYLGPVAARVSLGVGAEALPLAVMDWRADAITVRIPDDAPIGKTVLLAQLGARALGPLDFWVVSLTDDEFKSADSVLIPPDEKAYVESIIGQLRDAAKRDAVPELEDFAKKVEQLLKDAEEGKITKEQLLDALAKAEEELAKNAEPDQAEIDKAMQEMGKELAKENLTKDLGDALQKTDLEKAKQELEKLADKLDPEQAKQQLEQLEKQLQQAEQQQQNKDLTEQQKQDLQKQAEQLKKQIQQLEQNKPMSEQEKQKLQNKLEQVTKQMQQKDKAQQQKSEQAQQKLQDEIKRLQKKKDEAKSEQEKLSAERQLQKKKDELQKLQKDEQDKNDSAQRQALKRLQKDLEKAAENLDKPQKDPNKSEDEQDEEAKERQRQASRNLKDAARETGRVDHDKRKQATQKKMSSQMDDLREAMRRAKQKGNKGPKDPFNKNGKNQDFAQRARGQKGSGQSWKPGQQGQGQGQGGQGQQPGGSEAGVGHDDNLVGDPTKKSGNTKDQDLTGVQGQGTSRRETILAAAQKGFATVGYQKVYADYQRIVEEVMRTEKLPSSYKYYVKRYFAKIHPETAQP